MAIRLTTAQRTARLNALVTLAGTNPIIRLYTGNNATVDPNSGPTGTLLGTLTLSGALGTVSSGVLTLGTITGDSSADATGTAGYFRIVTSDATTLVMQGSISTSGNGGDMILNSTSVVAAQTINISAPATVTEGAA